MGLGIIILSQAVALLATSVKSSAMQCNALVLPHRLLFCSVAGMHKGAEDEVGTGSELWYKSHILSQPPRTEWAAKKTTEVDEH